MTEHLVGPRLPELRALLLDVGLRRRMKRPMTRVTGEGLRGHARHFRESMMSATSPPFVRVEHTRFAGRAAEWVVASEQPSKKVVLYLHGGGFFMSSPAEHRPMTWRMARACSRRLLAIDYRKAPDHAFPAWLDDAFAAYTELLATGHAASDIVVSGDSAGGNIALALAHRLKREGVPMPDGLVLFSPWADLLCEGQTFRSNRRRDAMFDAESVRALGRYLTRECDPRDPEVSPIHGDFRGFPRMLLFAGSTEVFLDDARAVTTRARASGVDAELYVYRHMPHVFPMFAGVLPRAKGAFDLITRFVLRAEDVTAPASSS
jgi:monoterpene epsilon-lactone hydrolase